MDPRITVANPLRKVAFQQLECLNSANAILSLREQVNVMSALRQQADSGFEVPEEPEAAEGEQDFH